VAGGVAGVALDGSHDGPTADHSATGAVAPQLLTVPENRTRRVATAATGPSLSRTLTADAQSFRGAVTNRTLALRLDRADSDSVRFRLLERELDAIEIATQRLVRQERRLIEAYHSERLSPESFLSRLVVVWVRAHILERRVRTVRRGAIAIRSREIRSQARIAADRLEPFQSPLRSELSAIQRWQGGQPMVATEATNDSIALGLTTRTAHFREVLRTDRRETSGPAIGLSQAIERFTAVYPGVFDTASISSVSGQRAAGVQYIRATTINRTELAAYLDSRSEAVFKETRRQPLTAVSLGPAVSATNGSLRLTVNRTYPGGPLRIRLTGDGTPVDGTISVAGVDTGRTRRGMLWTVAPFRRVTVSATADNRTVSLTHTPLTPGSLGGSNRSAT
jgi:hypothetical protein